MSSDGGIPDQDAYHLKRQKVIAMKNVLNKVSILLLFICLACNNDNAPEPMDPGNDPIDGGDNGGDNGMDVKELNLVNAFPNLNFDRPVDFQSPADGSDRIFVVEQGGITRPLRTR
jgi:hypothetical protein